MGKKSYNWCKWHQAWVIHDPTKCTLANKGKEAKPKEDSVNIADVKMKALTLDLALQAEIDDSDADYELNDGGACQCALSASRLI
jgi:hypothetical protein